jgi:hypothetical protein
MGMGYGCRRLPDAVRLDSFFRWLAVRRDCRSTGPPSSDWLGQRVRKLIAALGVVLAILLISVLSGCGYQGNYRYPCQDPANWEQEDCKPPVCNASDTCTTDLLPEEMTDAPIVPTEP